VHPPLKALLRLLSFFLWHVCISCCSLRPCWRASFLKSRILRCRNREQPFLAGNGCRTAAGRVWTLDTRMGPWKRRITSSHLYY
jgi:hypothetical protein